MKQTLKIIALSALASATMIRPVAAVAEPHATCPQDGRCSDLAWKREMLH